MKEEEKVFFEGGNEEDSKDHETKNSFLNSKLTV
jgi:hypothetical protein